MICYLVAIILTMKKEQEGTHTNTYSTYLECEEPHRTVTAAEAEAPDIAAPYMEYRSGQ